MVRWEEQEFFTGDTNAAVRRMQKAERFGCIRMIVDTCADAFLRLPYLQDRHDATVQAELRRGPIPRYRRLEMPYAMMAGHWREFFMPELADRPEAISAEVAREPWLVWFSKEVTSWIVDKPGLIEKVCLVLAASETPGDIEKRGSDLHIAISDCYWEKSKFE